VTRSLLGAATLVLALAATLRLVDPLREGLTATYFSDPNWSSTVVRTAIDRRVSTDGIVAVWRNHVPEAFSATWNGSFVALAAARYTFGTISDDGSVVVVDGRTVVDNEGRHAARLATGSIALDRGVHTIFIRYFQAGGPYEFRLDRKSVV